jgi:hypothetical protein
MVQIRPSPPSSPSGFGHLGESLEIYACAFTPPFVGIFSTTVALSATVADLAGMDAAPMSKLESKATDVVSKIFILFF